MIEFKQSDKPPTPQDRQREPPDIRSLLREWKKLHIGVDGILRRRSGSNLQLVLPQKFHRTVFRELHEEMGHLGVERVLHLTRERFYWPHMKRDIEHYVTCVCSCLRQRRPHVEPRAPMENIHSSEQHNTIHKEMGKRNDLTKHSLPCCEHYLKARSHGGKTV